MTELQLRLWCLWMCEEFSEMDDWSHPDGDIDASFEAAAEGATPSMREFLSLLSCWRDPLECLDLLDEMP